MTAMADDFGEREAASVRLLSAYTRWAPSNRTPNGTTGGRLARFVRHGFQSRRTCGTGIHTPCIGYGLAETRAVALDRRLHGRPFQYSAHRLPEGGVGGE